MTISTIIGKPDSRTGHVDYVPTLFVFNTTSTQAVVDQVQMSHTQIQEREERHLKRMGRATDCVQVHKKKRAKGGQSNQEVESGMDR